jgi:death-on-curing protein
MVVAIHDEQLTIHGGASGLRDEGMLESALDRPKNRWSYEQAELAELAAAYAFGIARNHPFVDGNKRTSLLALYTLLGVNGVDFIAPEADAAAVILSLAAGEVSEEGLTRWIRDNWPAEPRVNGTGRTNGVPPLPSHQDCGNSTRDANIDWGDRWQSITKWRTRPLTAMIMRRMSRPMRASSSW